MITNKSFEQSEKKCSSLSFGFSYCLLGLLLTGVALATVITLWLQSIPSSRNTSLSSKSISSISSSTTTTTPILCGTTCLHRLWTSATNRSGRWNFDNNLIDDITNSLASAVVFPSYISGYVNQALFFSTSLNQMVTTSIISLTGSSFTVDAWIYPTSFPNIQDHGIFGLCTSLAQLECLHLTIRSNAGNYFLYFDYYGEDLMGNTQVLLNQWIHVAFVFEINSYIQSIYVNGVLDTTRTATGPFKSNPDRATIGGIPNLIPLSGFNYFEGIIDRLTVTTRDKPACEILEEATLATYFSFDTGVQLTDRGPNALSATGQNVATVNIGRLQQAISLTGTTASYFQVSGLTGLGITNSPFSISIWIRPRRLSGVILHVARSQSRSAWCLPFLGFASTGAIVAQIYNSRVVSVRSSSIPVISSWTHIVQTWSPINGLRLYTDNVLVASTTAMALSYTASGVSNFVTLGNVLNDTTCLQGAIGALTPYDGEMDEFRIYSRELTAADICRLYAI